jgi:hypothetical protein
MPAGSVSVLFVLIALLIGIRTFSRWMDPSRGGDYEPLDPDARADGKFPSAEDALDQDMLFHAQAPIRGRHHDGATPAYSDV